MRKGRRLALLVAATSGLSLLPGIGHAQVTIQSFDNFNPDNLYGSWLEFPPTTTITSGPTSWETASTDGYGSCYYGYYTHSNGGHIDATGYSMLQLSFTINSGDAGMFVDLDDGEGDEWQWMMGGFGLQPGNYVIDLPLTSPTAKIGTAPRNLPAGGFDFSQITGMNFELDPGADSMNNPNPYDVTWSDLSAVNPNLTWNNANYTTLNITNSTADGVTWDSAKNLNFNNGTNASYYADGSHVTFNDANSGNYAVTLNSTVKPGSVTVNNGLGNYSIAGTGSIAGSTPLLKTGSGTLTLSTANTYTGGTTISGGTLAVGNQKALGFGGVVTGSPGSTTVNANGTIDLAGQTVTQPITLNGGSLINSSTTTAAGVTSGILGDGIVGATALSGDASLTYGGSGTGAAATPVLGIGVQTFSLTNGGSGYTGRSNSNPTVTVTGGGGTGAILTAVTSTAGVVTGINIVSPGVGFTSAPTITISAPAAGGTQATVQSFNLFTLLGIQQTAPGSGYNSAASAAIAASSGSATLGTPVVSGITLIGSGNVGGVGNINLLGTVSGSGSLNKIGSGTVTLSASNSYSGGTNVSGGTLVAGVPGALPTGAVGITNGTLLLGASTGQATITSLSISGSGTLDVNNNHVIINYGSGPDPAASIGALLATGYNGGAWNGAGGITSTAAAANSGSYGVGWADSADAGNPAGLSSGTILIKYTLLGDADLNGIVSGIDFGIVAANFNKSVTSWDQGDFDYNHIVSGIDFGDLAANFNKGASGASDWAALVQFAEANGLMADVPEPASIGLVALGACGLLARRRQRSR